MRKYGKWALTLGLLAATTPGMTFAEALKAAGGAPAAKQAGKTYNQEMADKIANALRKEKLAAFDVEIEFKDGIATIKGSIVDKKQKRKCHDTIAKVPGVTQVDDSRLSILPPKKVTDRMRGTQPGAVVQAGHEGSAKDKRVQQVNHVQGTQEYNQKKAEEIGAALSGANLDGYDIGIKFHNGVAMLEGQVPTNAQAQLAEQLAGEIPEVQSVANRLQVTEERPMPPQMAPGAYDPRMMPPPGYDPRMAQDPRAMMAANGVDPRMIPAGYQGQPGMPPGAPVPPPAPYAHPGMGMTPAGYTQPMLPEHAWPAYAQYPNSAAVTYPQQYSASAWPYIGPFYPYPQVPLGWRDATLRWDDGQWNLQFRQRTDKWWWFMKPKNW